MWAPMEFLILLKKMLTLSFSGPLSYLFEQSFSLVFIPSVRKNKIKLAAYDIRDTLLSWTELFLSTNRLDIVL